MEIIPFKIPSSNSPAITVESDNLSITRAVSTSSVFFTFVKKKKNPQSSCNVNVPTLPDHYVRCLY